MIHAGANGLSEGFFYLLLWRIHVECGMGWCNVGWVGIKGVLFFFLFFLSLLANKFKSERYYVNTLSAYCHMI